MYFTVMLVVYTIQHMVRYESDPAAARDHADGAAARETYKTGARCYVALLFAGCW